TARRTVDPDELRAHLDTIFHRDPAGAQGLVQSISAACWPGGAHDRADPVAVEWVRRWRPRAGHAVRAVCSCRVGRCALCN
ncbi:MAG: hypothetical protein QOF83_1345, partial [Solirubrobacteraceae bacterium]|nr:hypothetical protein [Solirubrobacteraceae bacterium]